MVSEIDLRVTWEANSGYIRPRVLSRELAMCWGRIKESLDFGMETSRLIGCQHGDPRRDLLEGGLVSRIILLEEDLYRTTVSPAEESG